MKKLAFILALLCSSPAWATFTCTQGATTCTSTTARTCSGTTSCAITVGATTAHGIGVICFQSNVTTVTVSSTSDGGYTAVATSHGSDATAGGVECAYNLNETGGATSITCTFSASQTNQCMFREFTYTASGVTFDVGATVDDSAAATSQPGAALSLTTGNNYLLIQSSGCAGTCSAINQSYNANFFNGDGMAHKINVSVAGTTPNWTTTSARMAGGAIAIYENAAAGTTCKPTMSTLGVSSCG